MKWNKEQVKILLAHSIINLCQEKICYKDQVNIQGHLKISVDDTDGVNFNIDETVSHDQDAIIHKNEKDILQNKRILNKRRYSKKSSMTVCRTIKKVNHKISPGLGNITYVSDVAPQVECRETSEIQTSGSTEKETSVHIHETTLQYDQDTEHLEFSSTQVTDMEHRLEQDEDHCDTEILESDKGENVGSKGNKDEMTECPEQALHSATQREAYPCHICGKNMSSLKALSKHLTLHSEKKGFNCEMCGKSFSHMSYLKDHVWRIHKKAQERYTCEICSKVYKDKKSWQAHKNEHAGHTPYSCSICEKAFARKQSMIVHERTHKEKAFMCDICGKSFTRDSSLKLHYTTHTGDEPYKCQTCGKGFTGKSALERHNRTHTGEKPCVCDVCGKTFTQPCNLQAHYATHSDIKPYTCKVCGKAFRRSSHLMRHSICHAEEKPYVCKVCGKAFKRSVYLQNHEVTHTAEKPYVCKICGTAFNHSSNLRQHNFIHREVNPYPCLVCKKSFGHLCRLKQHYHCHVKELSGTEIEELLQKTI